VPARVSRYNACRAPTGRGARVSVVRDACPARVSLSLLACSVAAAACFYAPQHATAVAPPGRCCFWRRCAARRCCARAPQSQGPDCFASRSALPPPLQDEEGKDDGRGGRETTKGSIIELIGFGLGAPVPSDVRFLCALSSRAPTSPLRFALRAQVRFDRENLKVYMDFESNNFELEGKYRCAHNVTDARREARCGDAITRSRMYVSAQG
jgi:hypothetical protein